jgi:hypothetical protein
MEANIECKEVIISRLVTVGDGSDLNPIRVVLQVFEKDGSLIAEKDDFNDFSAKDMVEYALYCLESKLGKDQVIANLKSYCKDNQIK